MRDPKDRSRARRAAILSEAAALRPLHPAAGCGSASCRHVGILKGKVAVVMGAARGVGRTTAVALAQSGANAVSSVLPPILKMPRQRLPQSRTDERSDATCSMRSPLLGRRGDATHLSTSHSERFGESAREQIAGSSGQLCQSERVDSVAADVEILTRPCRTKCGNSGNERN
jgi:hypothetical protein